MTKLWAGNYFADSHTMTLTFNVATQMLCATRCLNMVIIYVK